MSCNKDSAVASAEGFGIIILQLQLLYQITSCSGCALVYVQLQITWQKVAGLTFAHLVIVIVSVRGLTSVGAHVPISAERGEGGGGAVRVYYLSTSTA